ncbi:MAG: ABC transporter ATP-binding protein [Deferrisomatales bacterium]
MLTLEGLTVGYGKTAVLRDVSLTVEAGRIVALLGSNGAGKSTVMRAVTGLLRPWRGSIRLGGEEIGGARPPAIVRRGLSLVPEGREVFAHLTVLENLRMGAYSRSDGDGVQRDLETVFELFPILRERGRQKAGTLSGGEQQMLAIGRALMARPRVLLLDEPSLGLAPLLVREIFRVLQDIHARGTTVLLVEQNAHMALKVADYAYILETGRITHEGRPEELAGDPAVKKAYLGT